MIAGRRRSARREAATGARAVRVRGLLASALVVAALALTSCGAGSSSGSDSQTSPTTTAVAAGTATGGAVKIADFAFHPGQLDVKVGDAVTFTNRDSTTHTATADKGDPKAFDTGKINGDGTAKVTFDQAGEYSYHCSIHEYMKGTIRVMG